MERTPAAQIRGSERGVSLIVTMMITVAVTGMAITATFMASTNVQVAHRASARQAALFVAEAGLERAQQIVGSVSSADWSYFLGGSTSSGSGSVAAPAVPDTLGAGGDEKRPVQTAPNLRGRLLVSGINGSRWSYRICYPSEIQATGNTSCLASDVGLYTVYVRDNAPDLKADSSQAPDDSDSVLILRIVGSSPDEGTRVTLEAGIQVGGASYASPTYGGINENVSNSNLLVSNINYATAGTDAQGNQLVHFGSP